jgi:hypothetical protein
MQNGNILKNLDLEIREFQNSFEKRAEREKKLEKYVETTDSIVERITYMVKINLSPDVIFKIISIESDQCPISIYNQYVACIKNLDYVIDFPDTMIADCCYVLYKKVWLTFKIVNNEAKIAPKIPTKIPW